VAIDSVTLFRPMYVVNDWVKVGLGVITVKITINRVVGFFGLHELK